MKPWMKIGIPVVIIVLIGAWYAFRPERLVVNREVNEAPPAAAAPTTTTQSADTTQPIESGMFYSILHPTKGTATIIQMPDGSHVLRFTDFSTSNGPDVHVYMVASDDANDVATVQHAGFIDLGPIKGNIGDQNYTLTSDVDLSKYRAVSIWCKRFSVNFGAAALKPNASGTPTTSNSDPVAVGDAKASQSSR
jgi:Electron transfer DM13